MSLRLAIAPGAPTRAHKLGPGPPNTTSRGPRPLIVSACIQYQKPVRYPLLRALRHFLLNHGCLTSFLRLPSPLEIVRPMEGSHIAALAPSGEPCISTRKQAWTPSKGAEGKPCERGSEAGGRKFCLIELSFGVRYTWRCMLYSLLLYEVSGSAEPDRLAG